MKTKCIDIEIAIMQKFDIRRNLIVPNITNQMQLVGFETDMLIINGNNYATGFEIKVSKGDLKNDLKKPQYALIDVMKYGKRGMDRYYGKFEYFNYAVPIELKEEALAMIHPFCGLWVFEKKSSGKNTFVEVRKPKKISDYKWTDKNKYAIARLGSMRILGLFKKINN